MQNQSNYWSAWMAGWVSATKMILEAQQRTLEMFLPRAGRQGAERMFEVFERAVPATAGDKPATRGTESGRSEQRTRRRGRPRKSQSAEQHAPRRRGRPPKRRSAAQGARRHGRSPKAARA
jgi:hypothetical protein